MKYSNEVDENVLKDFHICCFFRNWLFRKLPLRQLRLRFDIIIIYSRFLTSYNAFVQVWFVCSAIVTRCCHYWKFNIFGTNPAATIFIFNTMLKIAPHDRLIFYYCSNFSNADSHIIKPNRYIFFNIFIRSGCKRMTRPWILGNIFSISRKA